MGAIANVALPVFAIMLLGYVAGRAGILGDESSKALNAFVYWFALPPLLFLSVARVPTAEILNWPYITVFGGAMLSTFVAGLLVATILLPATNPVRVLHAFAGVFANTGYMGIPLFISAYGPEGTLPAIIATTINAAVGIGVVVLLIELDLNRAIGRARLVVRVAGALLSNPLVVAPALGVAWSSAGIPLPVPLANLGDLLGAAAGPCALFAMGLFLVGKPLSAGRVEVGWVVFVKLAVNPAVAWALALWLQLDAELTRGAVLLSALPTGALAFVVAQRYGVYEQRSSAIILISTVVSVVTVSALLALFD